MQGGLEAQRGVWGSRIGSGALGSGVWGKRAAWRRVGKLGTTRAKAPVSWYLC